MLDVMPGRGLHLEDAPGAGARGEAGLVTRLHPGQGAGEPAVDPVVAGPAVDLAPHLSLGPEPRQPAAGPVQDGDRLGADDPVGPQAGAALRSENGSLGNGAEDPVE